MIQAADNPGAGLWSAFSSRPCFRPGELLGMGSSNVGFKRDYYIITVDVKTGIKRTPLVTSLMRS